MSAMAKIDLPNVTIDRSECVTRYYVRVPGKPKHRIKGAPGSAAFMASYHEGRRKLGLDEHRAGSMPRSGTLGSIIVAYFASAAFKMMSKDRCRRIRNLLLQVQKENGAAPLSQITTGVLIQSRDRRSEKPAAANEFVKAIRGVYKNAALVGLISQNPALGLHKLKYVEKGYHTWSLDEIATFVRCHKPGSTAHLALCILAFTGCRPGDARLMGRQHVRGERIVFKPSKTLKSTGLEVNVKIVAPLAAALAPVAERMIFLHSEWDRPFASAKAFENKVKKWCVEAGLPHCSAHGIRKGVASLSAEEGTADMQMMSLFGWSDRKQAGTYTMRASRARMADAAVDAIERSISETGIVPPAASAVPPRRKAE